MSSDVLVAAAAAGMEAASRAEAASHTETASHTEVAAGVGAAVAAAEFRLQLPVFEGPLDLLLTLIGRHKLDITDIALATVTDEFVEHTKTLATYDLEMATEFLVLAATLLDLKIARLLPSQEVVDDEDLALLEARDLLFARLMQYRAYKQMAATFASTLAAEGAGKWREAPLEPWLASVMPEVELTLDLAAFARLAAAALADKAQPAVAVGHIHAVAVSVPDHMDRVAGLLRARHVMSFQQLTAGLPSLLEVVACFLALLELFRAGRVAFEQIAPLAELQIRGAQPEGGGDPDGDRAPVADPDGVGL